MFILYPKDDQNNLIS